MAWDSGAGALLSTRASCAEARRGLLDRVERAWPPRPPLTSPDGCNNVASKPLGRTPRCLYLPGNPLLYSNILRQLYPNLTTPGVPQRLNYHPFRGQAVSNLVHGPTLVS